MLHSSHQILMHRLKPSWISVIQHYTFPASMNVTFHADDSWPLISRGDIQLLHLDQMPDWLSLESLSEAGTVILIADEELADQMLDAGAKIHDIWSPQMSRESFLFHFRRLIDSLQEKENAEETKQYLDALLETTPNLVWYKDREGLHQKVNSSFCSLVSKEMEDVIGRDHCYIWNVDPLEHEEEALDCMRSDRECMESRKTCINEESVLSGDQLKYLTTYKSPLYDRDGSVAGTVGIGVDVTQEKNYQKQVMERNQALNTILEASDAGILCHTLEGEIISVNEAALEILGYSSKAEIISSGFHLISPSVVEEDQQLLSDTITTLKKAGDSSSCEYRVRHKDGEIVHVLGIAKLLEENGTLFVHRFLMDVTEQRRQEREALKRQTELINALGVDYNLVCTIDLDTFSGQILRMDEHFKPPFPPGEPVPDVRSDINACISRYVYEDDQAYMRSLFNEGVLKEKLDQQKTVYVSYRFSHHNRTRYYELKAVRIGTWNAKQHRIVMGLRDIDARRKGEMEQQKTLEDALEQARKASQAKSNFLSNMSHDIRTPMNAIMGFANLAILHMEEPDTVREYLEKIQASGNHLLQLINDVLDMSKIEAGSFRLERQVFHMKENLNSICVMMQEESQRKNQEFVTNLKKVKEEMVLCDQLHLNQALINVLSNAVKYTPEGGKILFDIQRQESEEPQYATYVFTVGDNGIGMKEEYVSHIFEMFSRERNTTSSGIQGTGLGMAITKNIIDAMGGTIEVQSVRKKGTTVTITVPIRLQSASRLNLPENNTDTPAPAADSEGKILIVEDNDLNLEIAVELLEDAGLQTMSANNGRDAIKMLLNSEPNSISMILMDIQMPVMNGYEAARKIRRLQNEKLAMTPILAMTANAFEEDKQNALKAGMNGYISKPIQPEVLLKEMKKLLN